MTLDTLQSPAPILVTGAHRSGTTWVGKMLAASRDAAYISEPLNVLHRPGVMGAPVQRWYTYIGAFNEEQFLPALLDTLHFRYHAWAEIKSLRSRKDALRMLRDWGAFLRGRVFNKRPLIKDPFAVFSALWFAERLNCQVVVTVRHPAAVASSLKRLGWPFDFGDLLAQPQLMQDWLYPFRAEMEELMQTSAGKPADIISQSSLLWRMIYHVVWHTTRLFTQQELRIQMARHEDLSLDPIGGYQALYASLGLPFTPHVEAAILGSSSAENPKELAPGSVHSTRLNSRANLHNWKQRLSAEEIARVRQLTEGVVEYYYPEGEW